MVNWRDERNVHCRRDHGSTGVTLAVPFTPKINAEPKNEDANQGGRADHVIKLKVNPVVSVGCLQ